MFVENNFKIRNAMNIINGGTSTSYYKKKIII